MTIIDFLFLLLIAGICGAVGQAVTGFSSGGCLVSIGVGFVGALLGTWVARGLGWPPIFLVYVGDTAFPVVWSIIGSAVFVAVVSLISGRRR